MMSSRMQGSGIVESERESHETLILEDGRWGRRVK